MKHATKILSVVAFLFSVSLFGFSARSAEAAVTNRIVKGSGPALYWVDSTGERTVFPNVATYYTWFPTFENILSVSDAQLTAYPLVGTVTYRPGAKLVKFPDSPKVYAVARYGVLRHVVSESIAVGLYGSNWRSWVHDISRTLESTYVYGEPIRNVWEYHVATEYHQSTGPGIPVATPAVAQNDFRVQLATDASYVESDQTVRLIARVHSDSRGALIQGVARFTVRIKDDFGTVLKTCEFLKENETCVYSKVTYLSLWQSTSFTADATDVFGSAVELGHAYVTRLNGASENRIAGMRMDVEEKTRQLGETNRTLHVTASVLDVGNINYLGKKIELIDPRNNTVLITCFNQAWCTKDVVLKRLQGETGVQFETILKDEYGTEISRAFSPSFAF